MNRTSVTEQMNASRRGSMWSIVLNIWGFLRKYKDLQGDVKGRVKKRIKSGNRGEWIWLLQIHINVKLLSNEERRLTDKILQFLKRGAGF